MSLVLLSPTIYIHLSQGCRSYTVSSALLLVLQHLLLTLVYTLALLVTLSAAGLPVGFRQVASVSCPSIVTCTPSLSGFPFRMPPVSLIVRFYRSGLLALSLTPKPGRAGWFSVMVFLPMEGCLPGLTSAHLPGFGIRVFLLLRAPSAPSKLILWRQPPALAPPESPMQPQH